MLENDFSSMVILKCRESLIFESQRIGKLESLTFTREGTLFNNFKIDINDEYSLIESSITWNEVEEDIAFYDFENDKIVSSDIKSVKQCKLTLWQFAPNSENVFMFLQRTNLKKAALVLNAIFQYSNFKRINLENDFFEYIINNYHNNVIGKTVNIGFNNINMSKNGKYDRDEERITEVKLAFYFNHNLNVKINSRGIVKILPKAQRHEVYEIIEIINHAIMKVD